MSYEATLFFTILWLAMVGLVYFVNRGNDFNKTHPELLEDEIFVTNTANMEMTSIGWKSKRLGAIAYDIYGNEVSGLYPVFRNKHETHNFF